MNRCRSPMISLILRTRASHGGDVDLVERQHLAEVAGQRVRLADQVPVELQQVIRGRPGAPGPTPCPC